MEMRKCKQCNKDFLSKRNIKFCCPECKQIHIREYNKMKRDKEKALAAAEDEAYKKSRKKTKKKIILADTTKYGNNISDYEIKKIYDKHISKKQAYAELAKMGVSAEQVRQAKNNIASLKSLKFH